MKEKISLVIKDKSKLIIATLALAIVSILSILLLADKFLNTQPQILTLNQNIENVQKELNAFKNEDQYKVNQELKDKIKKSEDTYSKAISFYEDLIDLREEK